MSNPRCLHHTLRSVEEEILTIEIKHAFLSITFSALANRWKFSLYNYSQFRLLEIVPEEHSRPSICHIHEKRDKDLCSLLFSKMEPASSSSLFSKTMVLLVQIVCCDSCSARIFMILRISGGGLI